MQDKGRQLQLSQQQVISGIKIIIIMFLYYSLLCLLIVCHGCYNNFAVQAYRLPADEILSINASK